MLCAASAAAAAGASRRRTQRGRALTGRGCLWTWRRRRARPSATAATTNKHLGVALQDCSQPQHVCCRTLTRKVPPLWALQHAAATRFGTWLSCMYHVGCSRCLFPQVGRRLCSSMPLQCVGGGAPTAGLQGCSTHQQLQLQLNTQKNCVPPGLFAHVACGSMLLVTPFCFAGSVCDWGLCLSFGGLLMSLCSGGNALADVHVRPCSAPC